MFLSGCAYRALDSRYAGPPPRPFELERYYPKGSYGEYTQEERRSERAFTLKRIKLTTSAGLVTLDFYRRPTRSENLIFVFPLLGGKNVVAEHFAEYFARRGYDTAIVHRVNDFKDPLKFDQLEELFRQGVIRDRIAIDFFEKEFGKKHFGAFGVSRGAINVAITAGIDARLRYNIMVMGGADLVRIFKTSNQGGIKKYRDRVIAAKQISSDEFYEQLAAQIKTDPKRLAKYINADDALLFFGVFDRTVPFARGMELRTEIGGPRTIYLLSNHYTSVLYTQFVRLVPPIQAPEVPSFLSFPLDYVERESLAVYDKKFKKRRFNPMVAIYRVLQLPFNLIARLVD